VNCFKKVLKRTPLIALTNWPAYWWPWKGG